MSVRVTPQAAAIMRRSVEMAGGDAAVRLRLVGNEVMPRLASEPQPGDVVVDAEGVRVFVDPRIVERMPHVEIGVSAEHERLVARPVESAP